MPVTVHCDVAKETYPVHLSPMTRYRLVLDPRVVAPEGYDRSVVTTFGDPSDDENFSEIEFVDFMRRLLEVRFPGHRVTQEHRGIDILLERDGEYTIIELKRVPPQTSHRIRQTVEQVLRYGERLEMSPRKPRMVLAIPSLLSAGYLKTFRAAGIDVWDRAWIQDAAVAANMTGEASRFVGTTQAEQPRSHAQELQTRLDEIFPGKAGWPAYQKLCGEVLDYLFCPPLSAPISERKNETETNRRDFILPNYANDGFWAFMRGRYGADHVVVDAKNYTGEVKKDEILQLANYLSLHGPGHFGMIITRQGADNSALVTRREQWTRYGKLILILNDEDIKQMLAAKDATDGAELLIRQKIEDFRLSI